MDMVQISNMGGKHGGAPWFKWIRVAVAQGVRASGRQGVILRPVRDDSNQGTPFTVTTGEPIDHTACKDFAAPFH